MNYIVGNTGFVGSNICASVKMDGCFHSTDVHEAYGRKPDMLIYAGLRAEKFLANKDPEGDMASILQAFENIREIQPKKLVLISTVDVYKKPTDVDESSLIETVGLLPYGLNRYRLEQMIREEYQDALIVRLPGLYGMNLKKNFLYDLIHLIPTMLKPEKFEELRKESEFFDNYYRLQNNGFYKIQEITPIQRRKLRCFFEQCGFSALNFTDSRASFQMYPLRFLWKHICTALEHDIHLLNIATEPVSAQEIYQRLEGKPFINEISASPADYRMKTRHAELFGGKDGYIFDKGFVLEDICSFVRSEKEKLFLKEVEE